MKIRTIKLFHDLKEDVIRFKGDVFEASPERFEEISQKLPGYVEEAEVEAPKKSGRKKKVVAEDGEA